MKPYRIPLNSICNFSLTEDGDCKYIQHEDIFDVLRRKKLTFTTDLFTSLADKKPRLIGSVEEKIIQSINNNFDFIPAYIGEIDARGHQYGSDITSMSSHLRNVDKKLEKIFNSSQKKGYAFIVLGDHGMVPVKKKVDIAKIMKTSGLILGKDYDMFLDSTTARFWSDRKEKLSIIEHLLHDLDSIGLVIDDCNYKKYRIPYDLMKNGKRVYGDIIWIADPGVLICPDYFHSEKDDIRGMHGYIKNTDDSCFGQLISYYRDCNPVQLDYKPLTFVCEELASLLGVEKPNCNFNRKVLI